MIYFVKKNYCECHPETCGHWSYTVVNEHQHKILGFDNLAEATKFCEKLNAKSEDR